MKWKPLEIVWPFSSLRAALLDIFETIDLDGNGLLSLEEYNFFELRTSGEKCDQEAWAVCKGKFITVLQLIRPIN